MSPEARERFNRAAPLLVGTLLACTFATAGLTSTLAEPAFEFLLHLAVFVAIATSAVATMYGFSSSWLGVIVIAAGAVAVTQRELSLPGLSLMFPPEALADEDLTWATLWGWLMVGLCFMLSTRRNVLFCLVAALAMFALTATVNLNTIMMVYFALMVFSAVFVWGYEHLLNLAEAEQDGSPTVDVLSRVRKWWRLARTQALAGTLLVAGVMVAGIAVGTLLYTVGPRLYVQPGGMYRYARWLQVSLLGYGGMLNRFPVGAGPVALPATPAIEVKAESGQLWRGQAYDQYTGRGWNKRVGRTFDIEQDGDWWRTPEYSRLQGQRLVQRVKLLSIESRALFAAARPVAVRLPRQELEGHDLRFTAEADPYQCLMTTFRMPPGAEFEIISVLPPGDAETLRAAPTEYSQNMRTNYIEQVPPGALVALEDLVVRLAADAETPYDKVVALRDYIEKECTYSDRAPAVPAGEDAVAYFVTKSKIGACDLFASGLAIMARIAGVPARVATGFMTGVYHPDRGAFVPLQRDAHAWAEIYFPGPGWVAFDAAAERVAGGGTSTLPTSLAELQQRVRQALDRIWAAAAVVGGIIALVSALLGPGLLWRWLRRRLAPRGRRIRLGEIYERFGRRAARMAGLRYERWRTPAEMRDAIVATGLVSAEPALRELDDFTAGFYARRYGPQEPTDAHLRRTAASARHLLGVMREELRDGRGRRR